MNYHHLSIEERSCIRKYYVDGLSYREIARRVGRNVSTISREIRRNCTHMYDIPTYYPHTAQKKYLLRRSYCHRVMFHSQEVIDYINEKLEATWSPEQIAYSTPCELKMPSWRTIFAASIFADPYCAWQKGTNENLNGLLREFYPKGRNLSRVAPATLKQNLALINTRPRKVLNFYSSQELWNLNSFPIALSLTIHLSTCVY